MGNGAVKSTTPDIPDCSEWYETSRVPFNPSHTAHRCRRRRWQEHHKMPKRLRTSRKVCNNRVRPIKRRIAGQPRRTRPYPTPSESVTQHVQGGSRFQLWPLRFAYQIDQFHALPILPQNELNTARPTNNVICNPQLIERHRGALRVRTAIAGGKHKNMGRERCHERFHSAVLCSRVIIAPTGSSRVASRLSRNVTLAVPFTTVVDCRGVSTAINSQIRPFV